jgi:hypothetical protein
VNARVNSLAVSVFVSEEPSFERFGEDRRAIGFFGVGASVRLLIDEGIEREHHHHLVPFRRPSLRGVDLEKNART